MSAFRAVGELAVFVTTYLLLSLVPFLALEPTRVSDLSGWLAQNLVYVAIVGTFGLTILSFVVVASTGIERYIDTLRTPTDPLSIVVGATFLGAAVSCGCCRRSTAHSTWPFLPRRSSYWLWLPTFRSCCSSRY